MQNSAMKHCPVCRAVLDINPSTNYSLKTIVDGLDAKCTFCSYTSSVSGVVTHLKDCQMVTVECPNMNCGEVVTRRDAQLHSTVCHMANVACDYSSKEMRRRDLASHKSNNCVGCLVECKYGCNASSLTRYL